MSITGAYGIRDALRELRQRSVRLLYVNMLPPVHDALSRMGVMADSVVFE